MENYYETLEVAHDAPFKAIQASYRRLALLLHPDRNTAPDATEAFQRLGYAWDILKDNKTRSAYDSHLNAEKQKHQLPSPTPQPAKTTHTSGEYTNFDEEQEGVFFFDDLMGSPLGGSFNFHPPNARLHKLLQTDSDIARAQIEVLDMKEKYQTKMKEVANTIKARYTKLNIQKSEAELMQAAEADRELIRNLSRITVLEEAIKTRFAERVAECMEHMKL